MQCMSARMSVPYCAYTSPVSIESDMLVTCCMQCAMSVSLLLFLTARVSCSYSVQVLPCGPWSVITLRENLVRLASPM